MAQLQTGTTLKSCYLQFTSHAATTHTFVLHSKERNHIPSGWAGSARNGVVKQSTNS